MRLLVATTNAGKVRELAAALTSLDVEVVDLASCGVDVGEAPEESGTTFEENALIKARAYQERTGIATVADDSGLEVAALGGRPGVASARYAADDDARIGRLLAELDAANGDRAARFVCALALVDDGIEEVFIGVSDGTIRRAPSGEGGFGYDPVFEPAGETRTFAEMSRDEKAAVSHRGRAVRRLAEYLAARR